MAAQIIPFPKLDAPSAGPANEQAVPVSPVRRNGSPSGLHIVATRSQTASQQTALRIVEDVCFEHHLPHPATEPASDRSAAFWATLPIPPTRVETPISVARRLAHMILPIVEPA